MGIIIQLGISPVCGSATFHVTSKDVDNSVLNFFGDRDKVHKVSAPSRAFDLVSILIVEY
jgi:hypothetical protein